MAVSLQGPSSKCWDGTFSGGSANFAATCDNFIPATVTPSLPTVAGSWSLPWLESYFSVGSYTLKVTAKDSNGATATVSTSFTIT